MFFCWFRDVEGTNVLAAKVKFRELQSVRDKARGWKERIELILGNGGFEKWNYWQVLRRLHSKGS
jgi:hypothetical protein